jgi:ABC-type nitrate/sulfonate/bicarbonate transport system permease component
MRVDDVGTDVPLLPGAGAADTAAGRRRPERAAFLGRLAVRLAGGVAGFAVLVGVWHLASTSGRFSPVLLPSPSTVWHTGLDLFHRGSLRTDTLASLKRVAIGFGLGSGFGVVLGVLLGVARPLSWIFRPVLEVLRPIPGIAWIPLAILWFGIGDSSSYFIVAIACFFPIFISAYIAITSVDRRYLEMARSLGVPRWGQALQVMLPAALPRIMTGLRVGLGVAWMTVIAAELVAARSGLGYMIELNRSLLQTSAVLVGMITIGVVGFLMATLLEAIERFVLHWDRP